MMKMKSLLIFLIVICIPFLMFSQEDEHVKAHFIALYTVGESWDMEKQPNEQIYFKEHSGFLSKLRKEKQIILGARYSDTGMIILKADDLEAAKIILNQDIALQKKLFNVVIYPFNTFYNGCIE